jgi:hypothetical protein
MKEFFAAKAALGRRELQDLLSLQEITDETCLLSLFIMNAFISGEEYKELYAVVCLRMFRMTVKYGISRLYSPSAITAWGTFNLIMGRFDVALEAERVALILIDKFQMESLRPKTFIGSYLFNHFWRATFDSKSRHEFLSSYQLSMSYGHVSIAHYGFIAWVAAALYLDDNLSNVHPRTRSVVGELHALDSKNGLMFLLPIWQVVSLYQCVPNRQPFLDLMRLLV